MGLRPSGRGPLYCRNGRNARTALGAGTQRSAGSPSSGRPRSPCRRRCAARRSRARPRRPRRGRRGSRPAGRARAAARPAPRPGPSAASSKPDAPRRSRRATARCRAPRAGRGPPRARTSRRAARAAPSARVASSGAGAAEPEQRERRRRRRAGSTTPPASSAARAAASSAARSRSGAPAQRPRARPRRSRCAAPSRGGGASASGVLRGSALARQRVAGGERSPPRAPSRAARGPAGRPAGSDRLRRAGGGELEPDLGLPEPHHGAVRRRAPRRRARRPTKVPFRLSRSTTQMPSPRRSNIACMLEIHGSPIWRCASGERPTTVGTSREGEDASRPRSVQDHELRHVAGPLSRCDPASHDTLRLVRACPPTHSPTAPSGGAQDRMLGRVLGDRYRVLSRLGEGGMGTVYLCEHAVLGRRFAVKVLRPDARRRTRSSSSASGTRRSREPHRRRERRRRPRLRRGGRRRALLRDGGARGAEPRRAHRARRGRSTVGRARSTLLDQICRALGAAHARGVVHRDVKPDNVFVVRRDDGAERAKVIDFGISHVPPPAGAASGSPAPARSSARRSTWRRSRRPGTPSTTAPTSTPLGVLAYEMLTGTLPIEAAHAHRDPRRAPDPDPRRRRAAARRRSRAAVDALVLRALAKRPEDRFAVDGGVRAPRSRRVRVAPRPDVLAAPHRPGRPGARRRRRDASRSPGAPRRAPRARAGAARGARRRRARRARRARRRAWWRARPRRDRAAPAAAPRPSLRSRRDLRPARRGAPPRSSTAAATRPRRRRAASRRANARRRPPRGERGAAPATSLEDPVPGRRGAEGSVPMTPPPRRGARRRRRARGAAPARARPTTSPTRRPASARARRSTATGRWREAIAEFEAAYRLKPHGAIHFNVAQCRERLERVAGRAPQLPRLPARGAGREGPRRGARVDAAGSRSGSPRPGVQVLLVYTDPPGAERPLDGKVRGRDAAPRSCSRPGPTRSSLSLDGLRAGRRRTSTLSATRLARRSTWCSARRLAPAPPRRRRASAAAPPRTPPAPRAPAAPDLAARPSPRPPRRPRAPRRAPAASGAASTPGSPPGPPSPPPRRARTSAGRARQRRGGDRRRSPSRRRRARADARATPSRRRAPANVLYAVAGGAAAAGVTLFVVEKRF